MEQQNNYHFLNWAQNQSCTAKRYLQPQTETELIEIIAANNHIRLVGTGHSWNKICLSSETLINLDLYNKVIELDSGKLQIKVQSGIKLWQLNQYLDKHGLALSNLGSIDKQSVAGAVSTGTHGTGINFQILGSQIETFSLIKADGEKILLHREQDKKLFNLCLVNIGCLGVISEVTLNVLPAFNLREYTVAIPFNDAIEQLPQLISSANHFKMWWFPHTEKMILYKYDRTSKPVNDSRWRQWLLDEFISVNIYRLLLRIGNIYPQWRKFINRMLVLNFKTPLDRIEKSFKVFHVPEPPLHREVEWSFDILHAKELLQDYKQMIDTSEHCLNFIQEIRFTKGDEYALSPCNGRDSIWLGAYNADNNGWDKLMADFEILAKKYNGRPHWGKEFTVNRSYLKSVYPQYNAFCQLRNEMDPGGKFANSFIEQLF